MELTHFSLCSGIGGLDLAAEWAGFRTIGQCEIDEYASKVLEKNFKGVHNFGDIRTITAESVGRYGIKAGEITVISAGIPCQPYSLAGKGLGDLDERDLEQEYMRVVGELKPRWAVIENTPGLFSRKNQRYFHRILDDFSALGYSVAWGMWGAVDVGAPHKRERVLLLPTPTASDGIAYAKISKKDVQACIYKQHHPKNRGKKSEHTKRLMEYLAFLGTPLSRICDLHEMIMGFPRGWTDLEVSEMR